MEMKVKSLHLQNYGRFEDLKIDFAPTAEKTGNVTVIVGNNGAGKSQILQALATALSWFVLKLVRDTDGFEIDKTLIRNGKNDVEVNIIVDFGENNPTPYGPVEDAHWTIGNVKNGRINSFSRSTKELKKTVRNFRSNLTSKDRLLLPIVSFYPVDRGVNSTLMEINKNFVSDQLIAYENALESSVSFESFFAWFREREDVENEKSRTIQNLASDEIKESNRLIHSSLALLEKNKERLNTETNQVENEELIKTLNRVIELRNYGTEQIKQGISITDRPLEGVRRSIKRFINFENVHIRRRHTNNDSRKRR